MGSANRIIYCRSISLRVIDCARGATRRKDRAHCIHLYEPTSVYDYGATEALY